MFKPVSTLLCAGALIVASALAAAPLSASAAPAPAPGASKPATDQTFRNLTTVGANLKAGNKKCPGQAYYLYSGGFQDNFASPADAAYPSPNLTAFIPPGGPTVAYDVPQVDARFGDSFNLQNTRGVCYAVIQFQAKPTNGTGDNDGLTFGHVGAMGMPFDVVGQVINPGGVTGVQSLALTPTGLGLLSLQTGFFLDKTPSDSILDLYLQDDTMLDFFRIYVWYGPNCSANQSC